MEYLQILSGVYPKHNSDLWSKSPGDLQDRLATNNPGMCKIYRVEFLFCNLQQPFAHGTEEGCDAGVRAMPCPKRLCGFAPCESCRIWTGKHLK